jgi:hypothetical protein
MTCKHGMVSETIKKTLYVAWYRACYREALGSVEMEPLLIPVRKKLPIRVFLGGFLEREAMILHKVICLELISQIHLVYQNYQGYELGWI